MGDVHDRVERVPIEDLIPYANNAKSHPDEQVKKIASSIKNYGWDQPIVVDADDDGKSELLAVENRVAGCQWTVGDVFSCVQPVDVVRPCLFVLFDLVEVAE